MANILLLVHRLPYPPDKGDKVRSYHLLKHLAARHRVFLGTFVDDPADEVHVQRVAALCAGLHVERLRPRLARVASLAALATGGPLTLHYYRSAALARWVRKVAAEQPIATTVVFSSSMAPYAELLGGVPMVADMVDVDSAKWTEYAERHRGPVAWVYGVEGRRLLAYERRVAARARQSFFVTEREVALFRSLAPENAAAVSVMGNGVDAAFFAADATRASPFEPGTQAIVFTGAMDYWPNVDAVSWFAADVLPRLRERWPACRFHIVGRDPAPAVRALASHAVHVTGTVPDVRPYLQHAAVVVAPLRLARGVQNKVLEAMAMGRPVVAARSCVEALEAVPGRELVAADSADEFVNEVSRLLAEPAAAAAIGAAAREQVLAGFAWDVHLARLDRWLETAPGGPVPAPVQRVAAPA